MLFVTTNSEAIVQMVPEACLFCLHVFSRLTNVIFNNLDATSLVLYPHDRVVY